MKFNISLDEIISSKAKMKILKYLFGNEAPMSESELAKIVRVSHMTINRLMKELHTFNMVSMERVGNANVWSANKESYAYKTLFKIIQNILTSPAPLEHLKEIIFNALPKKLVKEVILFGSISEGKSRINSDIDLFILVKSKQESKELSACIDKLSILCLKLYGNRLSPYILTDAELKRKEKLPLLEEIRKGIQII
ncbi:MAG: nucleotidyltransferase domain-containing protein [Firmicutes bacterium]|nr:nucleotidyltransferase domain-containing protein [Bacillota bacterium]